jgi:hypothetical protein
MFFQELTIFTARDYTYSNNGQAQMNETCIVVTITSSMTRLTAIIEDACGGSSPHPLESAKFTSGSLVLSMRFARHFLQQLFDFDSHRGPFGSPFEPLLAFFWAPLRPREGNQHPDPPRTPKPQKVSPHFEKILGSVSSPGGIQNRIKYLIVF